MAESIAYFNGEYVPDSRVAIHPNDWGFRYGASVYEVERTFNGKVFRLKEHMDRLDRSLKYARIDPGLTVDELADITEEVVRRNEPMRGPGGDFTVRQFITLGRGPTGRVLEVGPPTVCVLVYPMDFERYAKAYDSGAPVVIPKVRSFSSDALDPKIKHYSRMNFVLAELEAADIDPEAYAVLLDQKGNISESTGANFLIVTDGVIRTPRDHSLLQGISRMTVAELARQLDIPMVFEDLQPYDAYTADEAFLSTSSYCILPVATIDQRPVAHEVPGPITKSLLAAWSEMVGVDIVDQAINAARSR